MISATLQCCSFFLISLSDKTFRQFFERIILTSLSQSYFTIDTNRARARARYVAILKTPYEMIIFSSRINQHDFVDIVLNFLLLLLFFFGKNSTKVLFCRISSDTHRKKNGITIRKEMAHCRHRAI